MVCWNEKWWFPKSPCSGRSKGRKNQIFVEIASVSRDKIRSGLMCILQFSSMSDPSWMVLVLVLDSWGRRSLFGHLWSNPKGSIPVDSSQEKFLESIFSGATPSYPCFFMEILRDFPSKNHHPAGYPHQSSRRFLMDLEHHR